MTNFMQRTLTIGLLLILAATVNAAPKSETFYLEGIADGDTIYVRSMSSKTSYRVRLAMVDAPEKAQEYGQQSKQSLMQLLRGSGTVKLDTYGTDRYGRLISIVFDDRGRNVNLQQVMQGAAWVYTQFASTREYADLYPTFTNAERTARQRQLGLWQQRDPVQPWKYRRQK